MKDIRQSPAWAKYLESIGWRVEKVNNTFVYLRRIPLLGWYAKIQRPRKLETKIINFIESKYHPFQILIEPIEIADDRSLIINGFKKSNFPSLPTKSLQIDLTGSKNKLLKSFSQKTRYNIKLSLRKGIKIVGSKSILQFVKIWRENFERKRFPFLSQQKNIIALHKAFEGNAHILSAKKDNKIIATLFILIYDKVAYYMYAASSANGKKLYAPTLLTWEAILLSKDLGCDVFDFDGIYDQRFPIKTWLGFTKFKEGFDGREIHYPGPYIKTKSIIKI